MRRAIRSVSQRLICHLCFKWQVERQLCSETAENFNSGVGVVSRPTPETFGIEGKSDDLAGSSVLHDQKVIFTCICQLAKNLYDFENYQIFSFPNPYLLSFLLSYCKNVLYHPSLLYYLVFLRKVSLATHSLLKKYHYQYIYLYNMPNHNIHIYVPIVTIASFTK